MTISSFLEMYLNDKGKFVEPLTFVDTIVLPLIVRLFEDQKVEEKENLNPEKGDPKKKKLSGESKIEEEEMEQPRSESKIPVKLVDLSEMSEEEQKKRDFSSSKQLININEIFRAVSIVFVKKCYK